MGSEGKVSAVQSGDAKDMQEGGCKSNRLQVASRRSAARVFGVKEECFVVSGGRERSVTRQVGDCKSSVVSIAEARVDDRDRAWERGVKITGRRSSTHIASKSHSSEASMEFVER